MIKEYLDKYEKELKKCIEDLKHKDTWYKQIPNLLTFSRAFFAPFISVLFITGHPIIGAISTALICSTDLFDGKIARKLNVVSKFGADLDAVCDKFMFLWLALPIMINNPVLITNFLLEGIISFINVFGRIKGLDTKTVFAGKIKTCFLSSTLIIGYLVQFFGLSSVLFTVLASMTIGSQVITIDNYIKAYNDMKSKKKIEESLDEKHREEEDSILVDEISDVVGLKREKSCDVKKQKNVVKKRVRKKE